MEIPPSRRFFVSSIKQREFDEIIWSTDGCERGTEKAISGLCRVATGVGGKRIVN